jgi:polysaccharide deacetylase family protein (PEP-CTERM system associated)
VTNPAGLYQPMNCLTFDIEEHFQVAAFDSPLRRREWDSFESRVERNTEELLRLLAMKHVHATFFILGWVAERHRGLVQRIAAEGHEIASHGYAHEMITTQTRDQFREDVGKAKKILEDLVGEQVVGYRAPSFTITNATRWALEVLVEVGYRYDSSIFPIFHDRYGIPGADPWCHKVTIPSGEQLWEIPPSTANLVGVRIPVAGGGYFRLIPYSILRWFLHQVENTGHPLVMYLHPWEIDPEQPRMDGPLVSRLRHYTNLNRTSRRLTELLTDFQFAPIREVIGQMNLRAPAAETSGILCSCAEGLR